MPVSVEWSGRGRGEGKDEHRGPGFGTYVLPWFVTVLVLVAGLVMHSAWQRTSALPWITAALSPLVVGLSWLGWTMSKAQRVGPAGRAHVAVTIAVTGMWLIGATVAGPWTRPVPDLWGLLGASLSISWDLRAALHRPQREDGPTTPGRAGRAFMHSLGFKGADLKPKEVTSNRVAGTIALTSGENTVEDVQKRSHQFATALGIPKSGVRITENPQDASTPEFSFALRNALTGSTAWPGPSHINGTVFDPIPMGLDETGAVRVKTVADKSGAKHELQQGTTGAGKSSGSKVEITDLMTRRELGIIVLDTVKGIQTFGLAAPGLLKLVTSEVVAKKFAKRLMKVIRARTDYLGARDYTEWMPGCGLLFLIIQIEEASILMEELEDEFTNVVKAARSAGISLKVSMQRPSHDQISTTLRAQLNTVSCYGMSADDPVCMLPEEVQDAGADPRQWGDRQPGSLYMAGIGITAAVAATPMRTYDISGEQMAKTAAEHGPYMTPVDQITKNAFGQLWDEMGDPVALVAGIKAKALGMAQDGPPAAIGGSTRPAAIAAAPAQDDVDEDGAGPGDVGEDEDQDERDTVDVDEMGIDDSDDDPSIKAGLDDELESLDVELQFGPQPAAEISTEDARAAVAARLAELQEDGQDTVRVPDLTELVTSGIRSRAWFRKELLRLVDAGQLADEGDGTFRIVSLDDPRAA